MKMMVGKTTPGSSRKLRKKENLLFKLQRNEVHDKYLQRQQPAGDFPFIQRNPQEAQRRAPVHGRAGDVEGKTLDLLVHQDAEVVAEKGPRDAQPVVAAQHENVARGEERDAQGRLVQGWVERLGGQGFVVE